MAIGVVEYLLTRLSSLKRSRSRGKHEMREDHMSGDIYGRVEELASYTPRMEGTYVSNRRNVARSLTSCLVLGPTWCQTGSSCRRTRRSNERK
jgi:hypothetical protein